MKRRFTAIILLLLVIYGVYFVYLGPRLTGDSFASALVQLNTSEMAKYLCEGATISQVVSKLGSTGDQITLLLTGLLGGVAPKSIVDQVSGVLVPHTSYNALTGEYIFSLTLSDDVDMLGFKVSAGLSTPDMTLYIQRGPVRACIIGV